MKKTLTISLITGLLLLAGTSEIFAASHKKEAKTTKENIQRQITRNISCPAFIIENTGTNVVRAIIEVDEKGKITVGDINSSNEQLKQYVIEQLKDMTVKNISSPEKFILLIQFVVS